MWKFFTLISILDIFGLFGNLSKVQWNNKTMDVDPVARMESFRALQHYDPNGVFSHPKTFMIGEF